MATAITLAVSNDAKVAEKPKDDYLSLLGDYIGKSCVAALISLLLLNNEAQDSLIALAQLIKEAADQATATSQAEQKDLSDFITLFIDPLANKKDPNDEDRNKLIEYNQQYDNKKAQWDTKVQKLQTDLQSLTQKQQSGQDNSKLYLQVAQSIINIYTYLSNIIR